MNDAVPCACGAVTLPYASGRFVENNVVHAYDKCETWVVGCTRPGHPVNYTHVHPYVSALCALDNNHAACKFAGEFASTPDFCDCECHQ